jgi:hypothetical protein
MLCRVALVRTDVSDESIAPIIRVTRVGELGTSAVIHSSPIPVTLMTEAIRSSATSVLTRATRRNIPKDDILHVISEVFTAVTTKNAVFWGITPCGSC